MKKLNRMLFREIMKSKGQFIAAAAVIFAGIAMFAASYMSYRNLSNSVNFYYDKYKFLDYYAEAKNITPEAVKEVKALKGVKEAIGRISEDVGADMGKDKRVTIRLISLPDDKKPEINDVLLVSGGYFSQRIANSCLVGNKFAEFYKLKKGDILKAIVNLKIYELKIDGIASSPEFIYAMKSAAAISPSAEDFGIVYIKESTARSILGFDNSYNQLHVIFEEGADKKSLINKIEKILKPYGFINGTERKNQLSASAINSEITQLEKMSYMFPALFLTVAAMIIYFMLRRIVNNQRTLIGVMKALGYKNIRILWHYVLYSLLIAVVGALPAIFLGIYLGVGMTALYNDIFSIPVMRVKIYWDILVVGIGLSAAFCLAAGYNSAKKVLKIQPAEAMRTESPKAGKRIFIENVKFIWNKVSFGWKMSIRNIFRSPQRTFFTMIGVMFTIMFFMVSLFFMDCTNYFFTQHFFKFLRYDYKITFSNPTSYYDALELTNINGVKNVEPVMEVPVEIKKGWMNKSTLMVGTVQDTSFYKLINQDKEPVEVPEKGVLIAHLIADKFSLKKGDTITLKTYMGDMKEKDVKIKGIVKQYAGFNCYINLDELGELTGEDRFATGALMKVQKGMEQEVTKELFKMPGVETVEDRLGTFKAFAEYLDLMYLFIGFMVFFGIIMGFAIIFNTTIINIMERRRELASLRVLGYSNKEIERSIFRENMFLGITALIPGILLGRFMCEAFVKAFESELFSLEVVIYPQTYVITIISVFIFIILAQWANKKNISGLDMVEVLKNRES